MGTPTAAAALGHARACVGPLPSLRELLALAVGALLATASSLAWQPYPPGLCGKGLHSDAAPVTAHALEAAAALPALPSPPPGWKYTATYAGSIPDPRLAAAQWTSQCGQDRTVRDIFAGKRGGYFLELASNEAFYISNTVTLEQQLGWSGLCVEANEKYAYDYRGRSCLLVQAVMGTRNDEEVAFDMAGSGGGIVGFDRREVDEAGGRVKRRTVSLASTLAAFGAPSVIDYFSLDIEGAEYIVLQEFDFSAYTFLTLSVERPIQALRDLLAANGYTYLCSHGPAGDEFFFHKSMLPASEAVLRKAVLSGVIGEGAAPADWGPPASWTGPPFRAGAPCTNGLPPWN